MATIAGSTVLGTAAPQFRLSATNGKTYALRDIAGSKGTVIVFATTAPMSKPSSIGS